MFFQVKESSRVAKHAYKDLKSKFRDMTPPFSPNSSQFFSHLTSTSVTNSDTGIGSDRIDNMSVASCTKNQTLKVISSMGGAYSAPNSPICIKRPINSFNNRSNNKNEINYNLRQRESTSFIFTTNGSNKSSISGSGRSTESSTSTFNSLQVSNNTVPAISPTSSISGSSEMNLSQELQNHPLFKSPLVDRNVSRM